LAFTSSLHHIPALIERHCWYFGHLVVAPSGHSNGEKTTKQPRSGCRGPYRSPACLLLPVAVLSNAMERCTHGRALLERARAQGWQALPPLPLAWQCSRARTSGHVSTSAVLRRSECSFTGATHPSDPRAVRDPRTEKAARPGFSPRATVMDISEASRMPRVGGAPPRHAIAAQSTAEVDAFHGRRARPLTEAVLTCALDFLAPISSHMPS
jgi:hypothetical protein